MPEVRVNKGRARLSNNTSCCICHELFIPDQQYVVERSGTAFYYSHPHCQQAAAAPPRPAVTVPPPDVEQHDAGHASIYYRGHLYDARLIRDGSRSWWLLTHPRERQALAKEESREIGLAGLVSWLILNR